MTIDLPEGWRLAGILTGISQIGQLGNIEL